MSFLYPAFLAGALAIAIPIALHLLRRPAAPEVPFSAVRLIGRAPVERTRRRSLRDLLLLAARVAALLLLAAAFARPYVGDARTAALHVVAIDRSYSMGAPGRFERVVDLARAAIHSGPSGAVAVIAFDDHTEVIAPPGDRAQASAALAAARPGYGGTRYAPVVARARELAGGGSVRLSVVTDLQRAGWGDDEPAIAPADLQIDVIDAGAVEGNAAVAALRRDDGAVVATIRNESSRPYTGVARVLRDGAAVASAPVRVDAGASSDVSIAYRAPGSGGLAVQIDDPAGYPADDIRYLVVDPVTRPAVLVIAADPGDAAFYLARALEAAGSDEPYDLRVVSGAAAGRAASDDLVRRGAVVLLSTKGLDRRARDMLLRVVDGGGGLLVAASPDVDPSVLVSIMGWRDFSAAERATRAALTATDLRHPIFQPFGALAANLGQVRFARTWRIGGTGWSVAARFTDGVPALLERRQGSGRVVLFASDLGRRWNDFPLHPSFVPFAFEAVRYVMPRSTVRRDYVVAERPSGVAPQPGVYVLDGDRRRVAVNVDVRESPPARVTPDEFRTLVHPAAGQPGSALDATVAQVEGRQSLWRYGVILMLGALVAESFLGRRR